MAGLPAAYTYSSLSHPPSSFKTFWSGLTLQPYQSMGNVSTWGRGHPVIDVGLPAGDRDADPPAVSSLSRHSLCSLRCPPYPGSHSHSCTHTPCRLRCHSHGRLPGGNGLCHRSRPWPFWPLDKRASLPGQVRPGQASELSVLLPFKSPTSVPSHLVVSSCLCP